MSDGSMALALGGFTVLFFLLMANFVQAGLAKEAAQMAERRLADRLDRIEALLGRTTGAPRIVEVMPHNAIRVTEADRKLLEAIQSMTYPQRRQLEQALTGVERLPR